jgi:hypothetical protein
MSAETASSTDVSAVYVRLLDEGVDVWRPAPARRLSDSVYQILADARTDENEAWAFAPGEAVVVEHRVSDSGEGLLVAVARATDLDEPSAAWLRKTG